MTTLETVEAALRSGPAGIIVLHSVRLEEIRRAKGPEVAGLLFLQLSELLETQLQAGDALLALDAQTLAVVMRADEAATQAAAARLDSSVRAKHRFPVKIGVAHSTRAAAAPDLLSLARRACDEAAAEAKQPAVGDLSPGLDARYQRRVLLNRVAQELFSLRPFAERLDTVGHIALGLLGAQNFAAYFTDARGRPACAFRLGRAEYAQPDAAQEERGAVDACLAAGAPAARAGRLGWLAAPLSSAGDAGGAIVTGYPAAPPAAGERAEILGELARLAGAARAIELALEERRTMAAVTEQSADAIVLADLDDRVRDWNPSAETLLGIPRGEALGRPLNGLIPELSAADGADATARRELALKRRDAAVVDVELTVTPLRDGQGRPSGLVRVLRDIGKRKELERMKDELMSLVSHELRTPLTAIRGFVETLHDYEDIPAADRKRYLEIVLKEAKRLSDLVTNFLDVSSIEAGAFEPKLRPMELKPLVERAATLFNESTDGVRVTVDVPESSTRVTGDEEQLYRVLVNLLSNAIKYSPPKGVVELAARRADGFCEVSVTDHGAGIAEADQAKLFQKFYRVPNASAVKAGGTGLGLTICKRVVESHGGRIWVESRPGHGASFKFTVPAR